LASKFFPEHFKRIKIIMIVREENESFVIDEENISNEYKNPKNIEIFWNDSDAIYNLIIFLE
jgi:hypothetical protein